MLHGGKACIEIEPVEADVITSIAHKVAASREILLGKEDLPKSATAARNAAADGSRY